MTLSRNTPIARFAAATTLLALMATLFTTVSAGAITRAAVLARAQVRIDSPVPYSQSRYYAGYRTDCSGYVSMCWQAPTSYSTRSFPSVTTRILARDLKPGDALNKSNYHIRLFYGWLDEAKTRYVAYESAGSKVAGVRIHSIADDLAFGYRPVRYPRVTDGSSRTNVLNNGGFDTWARSWGASSDQPVWWEVAGSPWGQTIASRKMNTYRTARNSLQLLNSNPEPWMRNEIAQTVRITPGANYRFTAYVKSMTDPSAVDIRLTYLDANGVSIAETSTTGDSAGLGSGSFGKIALMMNTTTETVRARVSIGLSPRSVATTYGSEVSTTTVLIDDVSLVRPKVIVGITRSTSTARTGTTATIRCSAIPTSTIGVPAKVYVMKPGGTWTLLKSTTVQDGGAAGTWSANYRFTSSMRRGTYRFRTYVSGVPGYLGATSNTVAVTLR